MPDYHCTVLLLMPPITQIELLGCLTASEGSLDSVKQLHMAP